jgi:hypothetical protein
LTLITTKIGINVKKNNLLQGAIVALLVAISFAANADEQYPATDFQPKIIYQDDSAKSATPAASATKQEVVEVSADDAQYPATNFQPKVLFSDANYKHDKTVPVATASSSSSSESTAVAVAEKSDTNSNLLLIALLAVAAGFIAFKNGFNCPLLSKCKAKKAAAEASTANANNETGVARYLKTHDVSGVTKYLARVGKPTNVARYIAKQNVAQKSAPNTTRG